MELKKYKKEILLVLAIAAVSCLLLLVNRILYSAPAQKVELSVDGQVVKTLDLNKDADLVVEGYGKGTNRVLIKDGQVRVSEADCPDKVCVNQGCISRNGENIVCLPNRLIVRVIGD